MFNNCSERKRSISNCWYMSRRIRKSTICICENKGAYQNAKLISAFVFTTRIVAFLYFLNPKFLAFSLLLHLYRPVCVRPGQNPNCWFSQAQAHILSTLDKKHKQTLCWCYVICNVSTTVVYLHDRIVWPL